MSLSQDLMAAEAQIDAMAAVGLTLEPEAAESLCRFLRECAVEAIALEALATQPFALTKAGGPD
jgi:transcriptional regulator GlxA family with amidase domain